MTVNDLLFGSGVPTAKFPVAGTTVKGTIVKAESTQQTDFDTGKPKFYDDSGKPMMQIEVTLRTEDRDPEIDNDDGTRRLFVKGHMLVALRAAVKQAGATDLSAGDSLAVKYVEDGEPTRRVEPPPKQYVAQYKIGTSPAGASLLGDSNAAPPQETAQDLL